METTQAISVSAKRNALSYTGLAYLVGASALDLQQADSYTGVSVTPWEERIMELEAVS